jgi:hypothetical protein
MCALALGAMRGGVLPLGNAHAGERVARHAAEGASARGLCLLGHDVRLPRLPFFLTLSSDKYVILG